MAGSKSHKQKVGLVWAAAWVLIAGPHVLPAASGRVAEHVQRYAVVEGTMTLRFDSEVLSALGFSFVPQGEIDADSARSSILFEIDTATPTTVDIADGVFERFGGGKLSACGALLVDRPGERIVIGNLALGADDGGVLRLESTLDPRRAGQSVFELTSVLVEPDRAAGRLRLEGELAISEAWADELRLPDAAGTVVGVVLIDARMTPQRVETNKCAVAGETGESEGMLTTAGVEGSDVIVADLQSTISYPVSGDVASFGIATMACNLGTQRASWVASTNQHPVIIQNLFRLKSNRFEQIGMAWVKHGFYAVSESFCTTCVDPTNGTQLGVGCSDPYSASLNAVQSNMSPRYLINAHTGYFAYPWNGPAYQQGSQERRLLVRKADLDPVLNSGARYFMEGHYVLPDDSRANTQDNNASYREVVVGNPSSGHFALVINPGWATQRGQPAVRAWRDADSSVVETDIRVPGEGLFVLAAKASDKGTGVWRYSYALQNLNSDRSARAFAIQLPSGAVISNVGFHDIAYHSGEPLVHDPWSDTITNDSITWSTTTYDVNPNANALRYATIYNFYFDANISPGVNKSTIGLFKPETGVPTEVAATTTGPRLEVIDCNRNDIADACDLDCGAIACVPPCGASIDCNGNGVPDDCEPDCNGNGIADACDISACLPGDLSCADCNGNVVPDGCEADCDGDGIPDVCDTPDDTDGDGIMDCFDLCPRTTPVGSCAPPAIVGCLYQVGICVPNFPRYACIGQGGTPLCSASEPGSCDGQPCPESLCRFGCLLGDYTRDGVADLRDYGAYQNCFSGSAGEAGFVTPPDECLMFLDFDEDDDIDAADYARFEESLTGP
ncbi:MAG: hypothetical protein AAB341_05370 [Planctomycetota bacterium]